MKLLQGVFDFAEDKDGILAFINPLLLSEQQIMEMPRTYKVEIIRFKTNSILKTSFEELYFSPAVVFLMWFISGDP